MTIAENITRIKNGVADAYTALAAKGATIPQVTKVDNLSATVGTIPAGELFGEPTAKWFVGDNGAFTRGGKLKHVSFDGVITVAENYGFQYFFAPQTGTNNTLETVTFPDLVSVGTGRTSTAAMAYLCQNCTALTSVSFPSLETVNGSSLFNSAFNGCSSLQTVSFPALTEILWDRDFYMAFNNCSSLSSISFPSLENANNATRCFDSAFNGTQITVLTFPALSSFYEAGSSTTRGGFYGNTTLQKIYFPALKHMDGGTNTSAKSCFAGCTNLTEIHFALANKTTIEAAPCYSIKWGAPAGTQILFDL